MSVKTFNPEQFSLIIGVTIIKSWNSVSLEMVEDKWTFSSGTSGEATRVKNLNTLGIITAVLPQTSSDNNDFSGYLLGDTLQSVMIKDNSGTSLVIMPEATVVKQATASWEKDVTERSWAITGQVKLSFIGGNN